jgi:hypothetical protein
MLSHVAYNRYANFVPDTESTLYTSTTQLRRIVTALRLSDLLDLYRQQHLNSCVVTSSPSATSLLHHLPQLGLMDLPTSVRSPTPLSLRRRAHILLKYIRKSCGKLRVATVLSWKCLKSKALVRGVLSSDTKWAALPVSSGVLTYPCHSTAALNYL